MSKGQTNHSSLIPGANEKRSREIARLHFSFLQDIPGVLLALRAQFQHARAKVLTAAGAARAAALLAPGMCSACVSEHSSEGSYVRACPCATRIGGYQPEVDYLFPCPHGMAVRLLMRWRDSEGVLKQHMLCCCVQVTHDGRIRQAGIPVRDERLRAMLTPSREGYMHLAA